ncbi:ArsR/SmtB family transcription factor [Pelotomaculum propionicicum]|uniref:Arsenic resistance transcriptional regulator ArsR1 n=1 Tax=Pelotomaculum propionicicum TaxID=258475 RepID=A0A4Y7RR38_9FIRM|nr:metalloregulator ArsR/SmtB family transcription factor [Pelotomaculum propionicicum]NLI14267.1 winged helix-turn-helix transcriptional regulator [Peptococcaceae bacterium]TEB11475.1 Arsenic resistance transcriptional regulator ArsR1 [Pelotomaculum propionicicum]
MQHITYETLNKSEEIFRALADRTRIRIIRLLLHSSDACVSELMDALRLPQYSISRHLSILRHAGLVDERREGIWKYYYLVAKPPGFTEHLMEAIRSGINEKLLETDLDLFARRLGLRVDGKCVVGSEGL